VQQEADGFSNQRRIRLPRQRPLDAAWPWTARGLLLLKQ